MTLDEAKKAVKAAKGKAHSAARRIVPDHVVAGKIVTNTRLDMLEHMLASLMAERSNYHETFEVVQQLELRDHWEAIAEAIAK